MAGYMAEAAKSTRLTHKRLWAPFRTSAMQRSSHHV
jgi:hypothetical protein